MNNTSPYSTSLEQSLDHFVIVAVVPAFNVSAEIEAVLTKMPTFVRHIVVVDDASRDETSAIVRRLANTDRRIVLLRHESNQGVGGAMTTGFRKALELGAQVVAKVDGDGQMATEYLPQLVIPLLRGEADYTKGNRFRDFRALQQMPPLRRAGNMALSFCTKAASGYWNCFDPTNGFVAIRGSVLAQLPLEKIHRSYFFETSMLCQLYLLSALVKDIPIPARYGMETSNLSISRVLGEFPGRLLASFGRRIILKNFIYDFSMESIYLLCGVPLLLTGIVYGSYQWIHYARLGYGAPTGTIMIVALLLTFGFQILLAAIGIDLQAVPREPLCREPIPEAQAGELARLEVVRSFVHEESGKPASLAQRA